MVTTGAGPDSRVSLAFLLDVDNTLLDNDRLKEDLAAHLDQELDPERAARFWQIYEDVRHQRDYVDYPHTVELFTAEYGDPELGRQVRALLDDIPFARYLYPGALDTIAYLKTLGTVIILSDGDDVFQAYKIKQSGLRGAVDGHVLIYVHKEQELPNVFLAYPAGHYVAVDDKPRIVSALELSCPTEFTTVLVLQGKYALDRDVTPQPDYVVPHIADLQKMTREDFLKGSPQAV
jgi:FMN phosphatase YigB (HAD superfamily)